MSDPLPAQPAAASDAPSSGNAGTPTSPPAEEPKFTQSDLDRLIAQRLGRERDAAEARATKEREAAAEEDLRRKGEWERMHADKARRVEELEADLTQHGAIVDRAYDALRKLNKARTRDWPEEAKGLIPHGEDVDPVDVAEAIERALPLVDRLRAFEGAPRLGTVTPIPPRPGLPAGTLPGNLAGPRPAGGVPDLSAVEQAKAELRKTGKYHP